MLPEPGVYTVIKLDIDDKNIPDMLKFRLVKTSDRFTLPDILYGDINQTAIRVWNTFAINKKSTGILLTGNSGSGKSLLGEVISNLAISKGLPVVMVTNIDVSPDMLLFLTKLTDVVIFLDEYGKSIRYNDQEKMLSFFSDTTTRKLFIITENDKYDVSRYIRDRPGRIRYHIDYTKTPKNIVIDYLNKNVTDRSVKVEILELYQSSRVFSFDHLQAIVSEHLRYPNSTIEDIVGILNLGILQRPYYVIVEKIELLVNHTEISKFTIYKDIEYLNWVEMGYKPDNWVSIEVMLPVKFVKEHKQHIVSSRFLMLEGKEEDDDIPIGITIKHDDCKYNDEKWIYENNTFRVTLSKGKKDIIQ